MDQINHEQTSALEAEIVRLIDQALKERLIELGLEDIKVIAKEIMPDIDKIISDKVKNHFYEIGLLLVKKFGDMGD
jgi:hypothetical protein